VDTTQKVESRQHDTDTLARIGGWLFKKRTSIPVPLALALLLIPPSSAATSLSTRLSALGVLVVAIGELLRLWGVHHIGVISRTRSDRLGPLIDTGPFSLVRNPLYLGNILLWVGFAVSARLAWVAPLIVLLLGLEYHAIVRWEEQLLATRIGAPYVDYTRRVPRWLPTLGAPKNLAGAAAFSWADTIRSERGTLIAIVVGYLLLWLKAMYWA
jgi:protein-S-isoprenylcysteine O-methyltransferase Ste14